MQFQQIWLTYKDTMDNNKNLISTYLANTEPRSSEQKMLECTRPIDLFDADNPKSLTNIAPCMVPYIERAMEVAPDLMGLDEHNLYKELNKLGHQPSALDNRIRLSFWSQYEHAFLTNGKVTLTAVSAGVCRLDVLVKYLKKRPERVAWLICPPATHKTKLYEALNYATEKMRDILEKDVMETVYIKDRKGRVVDTDTKVNTKLAELQIKIWHLLDQRVNGSVVQRIESKSLQVNVGDSGVRDKTISQSIADIDNKLRDLETRERTLARSRDEIVIGPEVETTGVIGIEDQAEGVVTPPIQV